MKVRLLSGFLSLLFLCTNCSHHRAAEPLETPTYALSQALQEADQDPGIVKTDCIPEEWWLIFQDDQLTSFIQKTLERNPTLQKARANILLAATVADRVKAVLYPDIGWGADISRQKLSETAIIPFKDFRATPGTPNVAPGGVAGIPVYFTQYETEFTLSYNFDFWDKNRNTLLAAVGEVKARMADEVFARLQLAISVAQVYYQLQIDYKRKEIARALSENQAQYLDLIQKRLQGNLDSMLTVHVAQSNLASTQQSLLQIEGDIAVRENQLRAYLADHFEESIYSVPIAARPLPQVPMPIDLPLHLIAKRPDITSQLWLIESAGKQIEVAKAGFYPDFNLTAFFGYQTIHLHEFFKWPSSYYNIDPAVTLPIFDGGRLLANLHNSEVNYDLAIYQYNQLLLNAVREVLDGLAILRNREQQLQENIKKANYQEQLFQLTNLRVTHNLNSGLDYLISQQNMLVAQDQAMISLGSTLQAILALIKAVGGGYDAQG